MRNLKRMMMILCAVALLAGAIALLPAETARAAERPTDMEVSYVNAGGVDMGTRLCKKVIYDGEAVTEWKNGWYVINTTFYVKDKPINVEGTVNLILGDKWTFIADQGIILKPGSHLIIWAEKNGTGLLKSYGTVDYHPGIGSTPESGASGNLTINGGKIISDGGPHAPGIGGCGSDSGVITINGGTINAGGHDSSNGLADCAPGIGVTGTGKMNDIYFYGGSTTALSGRGSTLYCTPIGATDSENYSGEIHIHESMMLEKAKLQDGKLTNYNFYVYVNPDENKTPAFPVDLIYDENCGKVTTDMKVPVAYADDEITVTATPKEHYRLDSLTVTDRDGDPVTVTDGKFTMPDSSVVVRANFLCNIYPITVNANGPGTVEADESADMDNTVALIVKPNDGCQLASLTVTDSNNKPIEVSDILDGKEFTMPASAVTVTAEFETSVQKLTASLEGSQYGSYTVSVSHAGGDIETATLSSSKLSHEFTDVKTGDKITVTFNPAENGRIHKFYLEDDAFREHHHEADIQSNQYSFTMPGGSRNIVTEFAEKDTTENVSYVDEKGDSHTVPATVLTGYEPKEYGSSSLEGGYWKVTLGQEDTDSWYVVKDDIAYKKAKSPDFPVRLNLNGNVHLIIADGKTLTVEDRIENGKLLRLYGQEKGTGKLVVDTVRTSTDVCSAELSAESIDCYKFNVKNGKLTVSGDVDCFNLSIVSGVTSIKGQVKKTDSFTLGCADDDDRITIGSYYIGDGFINPEIAEGQTLTDGDYSYTGTLYQVELTQMAGKTLMLAHEHTADDLTRVEGVAPTYDPETDTYTDGVREHYKCEKCGGCFVLDENSAPKKISSVILDLKYFRFVEAGSQSLYLQEYNGTDRNVTVPDTVPESLYPNLKGRTITNIYADAFAGHTELETVTVGSGLVNIGSGAFAGCTALKDFYTTAAQKVHYIHNDTNDLQDSFKDVTGLTIHAPHASELYNAVTDYESQGFEFEPTDRHTVTWEWDEDTYQSATATYCNLCKLQETDTAQIWVSWVKNDKNLGDTLYEAAVVLDGEIYTDQRQTDHEHDLFYYAVGDDGRTIAQKCNISNCPHAEKETTFTIKPPARKIYGDNSFAIAQVDVHYYSGTNASGQPPYGYSIEYYKAAESGGVYTQGEKLNSAPTDAGTYLAVLTAPDDRTTASVGYTISRRPENAPSGDDARNACVINYTAETATPKEGYEVSADNKAETAATPPLSLTDILDAGDTPTVYVRKVARNDNYAPSEWVGVALVSRPPVPTGLGSTNATNGSSQNGTITDVDTTMEYSADGVDWTDVSSTSITGLNPGEYSVRVKATDIAPHGVAATVTVGSDYVALTDQNKPTITVPGSHTAPVVDDTLTAYTTATDVNYQWYRGDTPIEGATSAAYTVTADDVGYTIKVVATQMTDADGKDYGEMQRPAQTSEATEAVVKKAGPAAPANAEAAGFTPDYRAETFTVNEAYEVYSSNGETGAEIKSLTAALDGSGIVYIRAKETAATQAGAWLDVTLASRPAAPTGLTTANATNASTDDGQIIGTTAGMEYKQAGSEGEWTTATVTQTLVTPGTYLVRARATDSAPHGVAATVTVGSWQIILSDAQKPKARDLTYTGAPQKLVTPPEAELPQGSKEMQYALGDATQATEPYTTGIPEKTDAGTYYVWYMVVADQPYYNSEPACIPVEIKSATSGNTAPGPQNRTYDGSGQPLVKPGVVESNTGVMEYALGTDAVTPPGEDAWSTEVPKGTAAGDYYVWYRIVGDANHNDVDPACIVVTISEAAAQSAAPAAPAVVSTPSAATESVTIPKVPASVKAKAAKKGKVTVSWKRIKKTKKTKALLKQIKGIEVQISTDPTFTADVQTRNLGKKKTKVTLKGLQKKTVYYVRVRYTDGAGGVSDWSKVKKVKTKKK